MANFEDGTYGSAAGIALIAKVLAGRCTMKYTRVAAGKGTIPEGMTPKTMTEPADYVMDAMIAGVTNPVDGECTVSVQIKSDQVEHGFYCTGLLLYALDPDLGEIPYTYLFLENEPEWIRPASSIVGKLATFDIIAAVGEVDAVEAVIDPEAIATVDRVAQMIEEHDADPAAHAAIISDAVAAAIQEIVATGGNYYGTLLLTIPASGWVEAEEPSADHNFVCDVAAEDVKSDLLPSGALTLGYFGIANKAGMVNGCETFDGYVRFFSKMAPTEDVQARVILFSRGGESGSGGVETGDGLTRDEDGKLSVNIGDGLAFDQQGALTVNPEAVVTSEDLVDEDEALEAVREIINKDDQATT